jgi:RNA polymerase sigma-70 factor (ECF subfamily)
MDDDDDAQPIADETTETYLRLLGQHQRWLAAYVYSLVPRASDADDILQEVKLTMWRHFARFEPGTNFCAWARQIALHQILNYRRARQRRPSDALEESFIEAVAAEIDRRAGELERRSEALEHCLGKLPERHRQVIVWRYFEDCGVEEIARRSQRSVEAVYQLLSRIRGTLSDCVGRQLALKP